MSAAVGLQLVLVVLLAVITASVWGVEHAWHLVLGGLAAWVPNALFALRLSVTQRRHPEMGPVVFLIGEFAKVGATIGLMALTVWYVQGLHWLAWLVGLIAAVKAQLLLGARAR